MAKDDRVLGSERLNAFNETTFDSGDIQQGSKPLNSVENKYRDGSFKDDRCFQVWSLGHGYSYRLPIFNVPPPSNLTE